MRKLLLIIILIGLPIIAEALPVYNGIHHYPATCNDYDVAAKVAIAQDGDIIHIPAAPVGQRCTWFALGSVGHPGSGVTFSKQLKFVGADLASASTCTWPTPGNTSVQLSCSLSTRITCSIPHAEGTAGSTCWYRSKSGTTGAFDISGIDWQGGSDVGGAALISIEGTPGDWRIHNNYFHNWGRYNAIVTQGFGYYGLIDSNFWYEDNTFALGGLMGLNQKFTLTSGDDGAWQAWKQPFSWGDANFIFFENNVLQANNGASYVAVMDGENGAKAVIRYNYFYGDARVTNHGLESQSSHMATAIYNNQWVHNVGNTDRPWTSRGGTTITYNNVLRGSKGDNTERMYRSDDYWNMSCSGGSQTLPCASLADPTQPDNAICAAAGMGVCTVRHCPKGENPCSPHLKTQMCSKATDSTQVDTSAQRYCNNTFDGRYYNGLIGDAQCSQGAPYGSGAGSKCSVKFCSLNQAQECTSDAQCFGSGTCSVYVEGDTDANPTITLPLHSVGMVSGVDAAGKRRRMPSAAWNNTQCYGSATCSPTFYGSSLNAGAVTDIWAPANLINCPSNKLTQADCEAYVQTQTGVVVDYTPYQCPHPLAGGGSCNIAVAGTSGYTLGAGTGPYTVTASVNYSGTPHGTISPNTAVIVSAGSTTTFTITPDATNAQLYSVGGTCGGSVFGYTYTTNPINSNCTVVATMGYVISMNPGAHGALLCSNPNIAGHTGFCQTTPDSGYHTSNISGCGGSYVFGNDYFTGNLDDFCTVAAAFEHNDYSVTPTGGSNGTISPVTSQLASNGGTVNFVITPNAGYYTSISQNCGGVSHSGTTYTFGPVAQNCSFTGTFLPLSTGGAGTGGLRMGHSKGKATGLNLRIR